MNNAKKIKKTASEDWHRSDIVAAVWKKGWTLRRLSHHHGYSANSCSWTLHKPWPKVERIIADVIGLPPQAIWPSRYDDQGLPNRKVGRPKSIAA